MNQKELTKTFMMISNLKNPLVAMFFRINSALKGLKSLYINKGESEMSASNEQNHLDHL